MEEPLVNLSILHPCGRTGLDHLEMQCFIEYKNPHPLIETSVSYHILTSRPPFSLLGQSTNLQLEYVHHNNQLQSLQKTWSVRLPHSLQAQLRHPHHSAGQS